MLVICIVSLTFYSDPTKEHTRIALISFKSIWYDGKVKKQKTKKRQIRLKYFSKIGIYLSVLSGIDSLLFSHKNNITRLISNCGQSKKHHILSVTVQTDRRSQIISVCLSVLKKQFTTVNKVSAALQLSSKRDLGFLNAK